MPQNILIITYWSFNDALIKTYTLPYVKMIYKYAEPNSKIFLVTFDRENPITSAALDGSGITHLEFPYSNFGFKSVFVILDAIWKLFWHIKRNNISIIHAWGSTGGAIAYLLSVLTGKAIILDSYEPHAESMVENGTWRPNGFKFKILFSLEKLQTKRAKYLIATAEGMKEYANNKYGYEGNNFFVKPACVDLEVFKKNFDTEIKFRKNLNINEHDIVCIYAGKFGGIYLNSEIFDFFKVAYEYWGPKFKVIILTNEVESTLELARKKIGIPDGVITSTFAPHDKVSEYMTVADFAINPVKPVPSKRYCTSIKDGEYWAMGLPVVITKNISDDSEIIEKNKIGSVLNELSCEAYLKSVVEIDQLLKQTSKQELNKRVRLVAEKYRSYEVAEAIYKKIYYLHSSS